MQRPTTRTPPYRWTACPTAARPVRSPVTASVWNIAVEAGQRVQAGQTLIVLEAMKMEIAVSAPSAGTVEMLNCAAGRAGLRGPAPGDRCARRYNVHRDMKLRSGLPARVVRIGRRDTQPDVDRDDLRPHRATQPLEPVWISLVPREQSLARARKLERDPVAPPRPLYGIPFAIKDNIDVAGVPTTAGCPAFAYPPGRSATVVQRLMDAGAIPIGKTNLDQFATGLVGTRSPYGACSSVFDARYISGGSSSGSAVAVAAGLVSFALGTDTAGSGRVPAAFNNLIGLKPTRGVLSTRGVVPACRTLDCVSIFAATCDDAHTVLDRRARASTPDDPYSRVPPRARRGSVARRLLPLRCPCPPDNWSSSATTRPRDSTSRPSTPWKPLGGQKVEIDFALFRAAADLLYSGPWVAERYAAIGDFLDAHADDMHPVVRDIICGARRYTAVDAFKAEYKLARTAPRRRSRNGSAWTCWCSPPPAPSTPTKRSPPTPVQLNTNLGYYTNFVNLLDLAAVAVPAGFRANGLPFGISLIGPAFTDEALLAVADRFHRAQSAEPGHAPSSWTLARLDASRSP